MTSPIHHAAGVGVEQAAGVGRVLDWYAANARVLPWRAPDRTPWGVLVSEIMLQQTQVSRVEPKWRAWMKRWPTPPRLAEDPVAEAIRAWQGLGYPRRALRLHQAAARITDLHGGVVPATAEELRTLPGVGEYTAAAVLAFAFSESAAVLDTNVRRVLGRWLGGLAMPASPSPSRAERHLAEALLPSGGLAPTWSVAVMELGALICTARKPSCEACPLRSDCAWVRDGCPPAKPSSNQERFAGSDRQARGFLLRKVSASDGLAESELVAMWAHRRHGSPGAQEQAVRALASLLADGLLQWGAGVVRLPGE